MTAVVLALVIGGLGLAEVISAASTRSQPGPRPGRQAAGTKLASSAASGHRLRTSCRAVAHIGDSTSVGMVSADYLPDPAQRLAAQYADVGVRHATINASGGRSMVEALPRQVNGYDTARQMANAGFRGCWVVALGTNDTANVSAGSNVGRLARIAELMSVAHGAPVLWVNVKTLDPAGPSAESKMRLWNAALTQACHQYPNLRVYDWAAVAQDGWFISDGIHYTPAGYAARARLIARALAHAFPGSGHSSGCLIR
jgi:lysophospholipase L1-like esterase